MPHLYYNVGPTDLRYRIIPGIRLYQGTSLALKCGNGLAKEKVWWYFNGKTLEERQDSQFEIHLFSLIPLNLSTSVKQDIT